MQQLKGSIELENIRLLANSLPEALWCVWFKEERPEGKVGKIPKIYVKDKFVNVATSTPDRWASFDTVVEWLKLGGDGVGLLIGSNSEGQQSYKSGLVALDLDNVLGEDGELKNDLCLDLKYCIKQLQEHGVYTEISPSGRGLRALYKGDKHSGVREKVTIEGISREMYSGLSGGRYVTITGRSFNNSQIALRDMPNEFSYDLAEYLGLLKSQDDSEGGGAGTPRNLVALTDAAIVTKIKQTAQGKNKKLFEGDISDYGDNSAADLALAIAIARYTDDAAQLERVFGLSELSEREKWLKRKDYRLRTIKAALKTARDYAESGGNAKEAREAKIKAALTEGDSNGLLEAAVKGWGNRIPNTLAGLEKVISLDRRLDGVMAFDEFTGRVLKLRSLNSCLGDVVPKDSEPCLGQGWTDTDTRALTIWLGTAWGVTANTGQVDEAVNASAMRFKINTVVDRLDTLVWDGKSRLRSMLVDYFNADDSLDSVRFLGEIGTRFMISAVRRAYAPGTKVDTVLVLDGGQGYGKSNAIRTLTHAIAPHAFLEGLPALGQGQEAERALQGVWICELAELAFQDRVSTEHIKSFLSRCEDTYRSPYGRRTQAVKRTACFVGTTNQSSFVRDATGARRFWTFTVKRQIDIEKLERDASLLWAEAVALHKEGATHWLTDAGAIREAEASQRRRLETSAHDEIIEEKIVDAMLEGKIEWRTFYAQFSEVWMQVYPQNPDGMIAQCRAFSDALTRVGFVKTKSGGKSMWRAGPTLEARLLEISGQVKGGLRLKA